MKQKTAMMELIRRLENEEPIFPEDKKRLLMLEKSQLLEAYRLDPELMKFKHRNASVWFRDTYGL